MEPIEKRLAAYTLRRPPEALRGQVLNAPVPRPASEWKRLRQTVQACAVALVVVYAGCAWFEQGTEALRRQCRSLPPGQHKEIVLRQVAEITDDLDVPEIQRYLIAQLLEEYQRPYRGRFNF